MPNKYVHLTHNSVDFGDLEVNCASCHMYRAQGLGDGTRMDVVSHQIPNHTMQVERRLAPPARGPVADRRVRAADRHRRRDREERDSLRAQVTELQTPLDTVSVQKQEAGINYFQLTQA